MKTLLLLLFIVPLISFSQEYSEVVEVPGKTASQLYSISREWFAKSFISEGNALLMDDRISGKIIAKGSIHISESYFSEGYGSIPVNIDWYPNFTIEVSFKDGRYKNEITDISITDGVQENSSGTTTVFKDYLDKKEKYKNLGDPVWIKNNTSGGLKIEKATAKNQAIYKLICKTESEMKELLSKLQEEMKKQEVEW